MSQAAAAGAAPDAPPINFVNLVWVAAALAGTAATILWGSDWALNFLHVMAGGLWTGIDLFMGFVVGPALRSSPFEARRAVLLRLTPRTIFILPTLAAVTGATGWHLAGRLGYLALPWPSYGWVAAALVIITVLSVQGLGYLLPTQIMIYRELRRPQPEIARIVRLSGAYFYVIASQGILQVAIIVVMAKFRTGL